MTTRVIDLHLGPDTHANLPAAASTPKGALYTCTTHGLIYRNDGASWSTWATLGTAAAIAAALLDAKGDLIVASAADTAARLAVGANGQVLTADSAEATGAKWATPSSGFADPTTTKGDLIVRDGSGPVRRAVGTNGQVLTADSAEADGVKWATPAGGGSPTFHGVKAYRSAAYTIAHGSTTAVPWDAEEYDSDAYHDNSTNPSRLTVPTGLAGKYLVTGNIGTSQIGAVTRWSISIRKNGTLIRGGLSESNCDANDFAMGGRTVAVDLAVGDYVDITYFQQNGGSVGKSLDTAGCAFSMHLLG